MPENDARTLADKLAEFSAMQRQDLTPVIARARQKIETDFNQKRINQKLATLLQAI